MNSLLLNPHVFTPQGFRPDARSRRPVAVPAGSVWGRGDVERLRTAGWVVVTRPAEEGAAEHDGWGSRPGRTARAADGTAAAAPGSALDADRLRALTVGALALAGVPTSSAGLPERVRARLDPGVLVAADAVDAATAARRDVRELQSLRLRRAAWRAGPGRWFHPTPATVLVLLPDAPDDELLADLAAQEGVRVRTAGPGGSCNLDEVGFVTRMEAGLRYSPSHLFDLVHGLLHSRAAVAHSPDRFRSPEGAVWLEQDGVSERPAARGLAGGSLWHARSGTDLPDGPGYAVHGANAVPRDPAPEDRPGVLRWHETRPALLGWLGEDDGRSRRPVPSYPARKLAGVPVPDRTSRTASDS